MQKYFSVDECRLKLLLYFVTIVIAAKLAAPWRTGFPVSKNHRNTNSLCCNIPYHLPLIFRFENGRFSIHFVHSTIRYLDSGRCCQYFYHDNFIFQFFKRKNNEKK